MSDNPRTDEKADSIVDPEQWVDLYGDALFRFAHLRLGRRQAAEDAVQETFLAAINGIKNFRQQSSVSTWLYSILRNKIADQFRKLESHSRMYDEAIVANPTGGSLDGKALKGWTNDPAKIFEQRQFWKTFHECAEKLPESLADAYLLQELEQLSPQEICDLLNISTTNLSTRVYRARLLMRHCLDTHWFNVEEE